MTDDKGNIELPPLPQPLYQQTYTGKQMLDYTYAAILADRARCAKQTQPEKPKVHEVRIVLKHDGGAWFPVGGSYCPTAREIGVTIRWTNDGRAWIDSERNRELARRLRFLSLPEAADALCWGPQ